MTPAQDRRYTDKIIRLAEHRPTPQERPAGSDKSLSSGERIAFQQIAERLRKDTGQAANNSAASPAEAEAPVATLDEPADLPAEHSIEPDVIDTIDADDTDAETVAELEALDGVTPGEAEEPPAEAAQPERRGPRPGMSLLDFAQWSKDEPDEEIAETPAAPAEIDAADEEADPDAVLLETDAGTEDEEFAETDFEPVSPAVEQAIEAEEAASESPPPANVASGLSILEKLPVPVLVHSGDLLHYANHEFFGLTGYGSIEELAEAGGIGALFADPYEDDVNDEQHPRTDRAMRLRTRDGQDLPVEAFLQSVPWNGGKALILVLSRVKEGAHSPSGQSPLIAELEARVAEMRTIIDTATDGVVLISRDGNDPLDQPSGGGAVRLRQRRGGGKALRVAVCDREPDVGARLSQRSLRPWRRQRAERRARGDRPRGAGALHSAVHDDRQAARRQRLLRRGARHHAVEARRGGTDAGARRRPSAPPRTRPTSWRASATRSARRSTPSSAFRN